MIVDLNFYSSFKNYKIALPIYVTENLHLICHVQKCSGNFEISEGGLVVVTGKVRVPENDDPKDIDMTWRPQFDDSDDHDIELNSDDIYQELTLRGYGYSGLHKQLLSCNSSGE